MTRICLAMALLALSGCNHHEALEACLSACDESDEQEFESCVAFGDPEYDCRAGNRACCALAAECVGAIGTEVVDPLDAMCTDECDDDFDCDEPTPLCRDGECVAVLDCDDDLDCAPPTPFCRGGQCVGVPDCTEDTECPPGGYCDAPVCRPCEPGLPDDCGFGDSDCDGSIDEDCGGGFCGDAFIDPGELCDGPETGEASCADMGYPSGVVLCTAECTLDYTACSTEICFSMVDEDDDGLIDCEDDDCFGHPDCLYEDCFNEIDDDLDGLVDCDDDDCAFSTICNPEICDNEADDDFDELVDCDDPDCEGTAHCCSLGRTDICNGIDDDCDGTRDEDDPEVGLSCGSSMGECRPGTIACVDGGLTCAGGVGPTAELCNDRDDDCDGIIDGFAADLACDDGVFCNGFEYCSGACRPAEVAPCEDFEECTDDVCDESTTSCTNDPLPADTPCAGGSAICDGGGMCVVPG